MSQTTAPFTFSFPRPQAHEQAPLTRPATVPTLSIGEQADYLTFTAPSDLPPLPETIGGVKTTMGPLRLGGPLAKQRKSKAPKAPKVEPDDDQHPAKRGRPHGAGNYKDGDIDALLRFVKFELPLGGRGWTAVHAMYSSWARQLGRPTRSLKSLETKYKQLVKTKKPTGDAECPPHVALAHEIEELINEQAGTRNVNDSELDDNRSDSPVPISSDEREDPAPNVTACITRPVVQAPRGNRGRGFEIIEKLSRSLSPTAQQARDEQRATRTLQHTQIVMLSQQLRDSQGTAEALRLQVSELQTRVLKTESARERAELKLEFMQISMGAARRPRKYYAPRPPSRSPRKVRTKRKMERKMELSDEGSRSALWVTDTDIDDSDKENSPLSRSRKFHKSKHCATPLPSPTLARLHFHSHTQSSSSSDLPTPAKAFVRPQSIHVIDLDNDAMNVDGPVGKAASI